MGFKVEKRYRGVCMNEEGDEGNEGRESGWMSLIIVHRSSPQHPP